MEEFAQNFRRNEDGSWTCVVPTTLEGPNGRVQITAGTTLQRGKTFMGCDLARWLDEHLPSRTGDPSRPTRP